ncbi:MAG: hypothetical protein OEV52_04230 [Dehalococcoidia bacterium]|nr:hypothetical protein [Dehalococcoidia bacterium]MDH4291061.1 hypothetical protein [Dehalococcoidia bacterium]
MKAWGIIATILLIASLCLNVWYYTATGDLNVSTKQQLGYGYYSEYQLPFETMSELRSNVGQLVYQSQQLRDSIQELQNEIQTLEYENQHYRAALSQIQQEAQMAQQYDMWGQLLQLIFSLF